MMGYFHGGGWEEIDRRGKTIGWGRDRHKPRCRIDYDFNNTNRRQI